MYATSDDFLLVGQLCPERDFSTFLTYLLVMTFVKTVIYLSLFLGSKHAIHQKKDLILSYPVV